MEKKKKIIVSIATAMAILSSVGTAGYVMESSASSVNKEAISKTNTTETTNCIVNPWYDCKDNIAMAEGVAGFKMEIPFFSNFNISAMEGIINIDIPVDETNKISVIKADKKIDNPSGLYSVTEKKSTNKGLKVKDVIYLYDNNNNNKILGAVWEKNSYNYSVVDTTGINERSLVTYINSVANMN